MKNLSPFWITIILLTIVICGWLLFPILTWGGRGIWAIMPVFILLLQIIITFQFKKLHLLWLVLLNPVVFLVLFNTIKASLNYVSRKPTLTQTCCCAGWVSPGTFDEKKMVYIDFFDDDCGDWTGSYHYTLNINNGVTEVLIDVFGNPIKAKK